MDIYEIVGRNIREQRRRAGLTMEALAEKAKISSSFLAYIETRGRKASLETIKKVADALKISIGKLFEAIPEREKVEKYDVVQRFIHIVGDRNNLEKMAILDAVKAISRMMGKKKRRRP